MEKAEFIENVIMWLDMLKAFTEFEYKIMAHRRDYLFLRIKVENKQYNIEVQEV